jgi:hypothetical protein
MQVLEPAGQIMEDEKKITGHENRVDQELDQERPQGLCFFLLRNGMAGHLPHFAIAHALGRAGLRAGTDFYLRARGFFLRSSSLLAEEYG